MKVRAWWVIFLLAAIGWGHAVVRLYLRNQQPSVARLVRFVMPDGTPHAEDITCHGALVVVGDVAWQGCNGGIGTAGHWLVRFDMRAGTGTLYPVEGETIHAAAVHPGGALAIGTRGAIYVAHGNTLERWRKAEMTLYRGLTWRGDTLELVDYLEIVGDGGRRSVPTPDGKVELAAAYPNAGGWRFVFTRVVTPVPPTGKIPVELIETSESRPPRTLTTLELDERFAKRLDFGVGAFVLEGVMDRTAAGIADDGQVGYTLDGDNVVPPLEPPGEVAAEYGYNYDLVLSPGRAPEAVALKRAMETQGARVRGRWLRFVGETDASLVDVATGTHGPPITNSFWLRIGFKIFPATDGGMWIMGGLGEAYVHVDASLARTDHLTFGERMARLAVFDRAKRNSDFYLVFPRTIAVPMVLLGFPALLPLALYALLVRRREHLARPARIGVVIAGLAYIAVRLLLWGAYSDLTGQFYS